MFKQKKRTRSIRKQVKIHGEELVKKILHGDGDKIFSESVEYFKKEEIRIEVSNVVLAMVNMDEKALSKHYGLSKGILGTWATPTRRSDARELEKNGGIVARYLHAKICEEYNIEVEKKESVMNKIRWARVSA